MTNKKTIAYGLIASLVMVALGVYGLVVESTQTMGVIGLWVLFPWSIIYLLSNYNNKYYIGASLVALITVILGVITAINQTEYLFGLFGLSMLVSIVITSYVLLRKKENE